MFRTSVWKTALMILAVFAAGLTLGVVGTARSIQRAYRERMDPQNWQPRTEEWLRKELGLSSEQITAAEPDIRRYIQELIALRDDADADRKQVIGRFLKQLAPGLTPEQKQKLETLIREKQKPSSAAGLTAS
jgi:Spy/CpxP family protein refolding chaperone